MNTAPSLTGRSSHGDHTMTAYRQRLDAGTYKQGRTGTETTEAIVPLEPEQEVEAGTFVFLDCGRGFDSEHGLKIHRTAHGTENGDA